MRINSSRRTEGSDFGRVRLDGWLAMIIERAVNDETFRSDRDKAAERRGPAGQSSRPAGVAIPRYEGLGEPILVKKENATAAVIGDGW